MTSRELVIDALEFRSPERIPRQLWVLPWAERTWPAELAAIRKKYPDDIVQSPGFLTEPLKTSGDEYAPGIYVDEWGCRFESRQAGIIGEVKEPRIAAWSDLDGLRLPKERLSVDVRKVDDFCAASGAFVHARTVVRPFELLQFLRGPENLYVDLAERPDGLFRLIEKVHGFFKEELELWASTEVDALFFADDWGSQNSLLISPVLWRELFKPLYREYAEVAHRHGKYIFMHSDGHIAAIYPDIIEIGVDALNSQLFCMDVKELGRRFRNLGPRDLTALLAFSASVFSKDKVVESQWAPRPVMIDGASQDWNDATPILDAGSKARYALKNDGRNFYIILVFNSDLSKTTIDYTGIEAR